MPEIHGTPFLETAKDKLVTELEALKTSMVTDAISPLYSYVYQLHNVAHLQLNAVTIDLESAEPNIVGTNDIFVRWIITYSIRVHTAYSDGIQDGQKQMRLLNSITEKLKDNVDLAGGYRVQEINSLVVRQEFSESDTLGGELQAVVSIDVENPQE